jgi:hypothetical protein
MRDGVFMQTLINLLVVQPYAVERLYLRGNLVSVAGSTYQCLVDNTIGIAPNTTNSPNWRLLAAKGDAGGTGGQDTAYNAATWDGQLWAPSANAIRDKIETLASIAQLSSYAPLNSPALTGSPSRNSSPLAGDRSGQLPTTQWIGNEFAPLTNAALLGNPSAPTPGVNSDSDAIATTRWVRSANGRVLCIARRSATQALTVGSFTDVLCDAEQYDPSNTLSGATFTAPASTWYRFSILLNVLGNGTTLAVYFGLRSGGTEFFRFDEKTASGTWLAVSGSTLVQLSANAQVTVGLVVNGTSVTTASLRAQSGLVFNQLVAEQLNL